VEDCVQRKLNTSNLTESLCSGSNSSYLRAAMEQMGIVYGDEESTRESCGILHSTHFPEVSRKVQGLLYSRSFHPLLFFMKPCFPR
jgi:hypothetical protein